VKFTSKLWDATCEWHHTVLSATRQRWPPRLHPNRAGWYSIYWPCKDERLSWPSWLVTYSTFYIGSFILPDFVAIFNTVCT